MRYLLSVIILASCTSIRVNKQDETHWWLTVTSNSMENALAMAIKKANQVHFCFGNDYRMTEGHKTNDKYTIIFECPNYEKEKDEKEEARLTEEIKTNKCVSEFKKDCIRLNELGEKYNDNSITLIALSYLCVEGDDIQLDHCQKLIIVAAQKGRQDLVEEGARVGCRYLEGKICSTLFSIQKAKGKKELALKIFDLSQELLKKECWSGILDSCKELGVLSTSCYADLIECKNLKLTFSRWKAEWENLKEQQSQVTKEERYKQEILSIENQKLNLAQQQEERKRLLDSANQIQKVFNKSKETSQTVFIQKCKTTYSDIDNSLNTICN